MNEEELVNYIHKDACMGEESTTTLMNTIENKDNKIKEVVQDVLRSYKDFKKKSEVLLKDFNEPGKEPSAMASISADMGIKFKMLKDNSDAAIADMLIRGLTMGEIEMSKKIESFDDNVSSEVKDLAEEFKNFQSNAIVKLKKYL